MLLQEKTNVQLLSERKIHAAIVAIPFFLSESLTQTRPGLLAFFWDASRLRTIFFLLSQQNVLQFACATLG